MRTNRGPSLLATEARYRLSIRKLTSALRKSEEYALSRLAGPLSRYQSGVNSADELKQILAEAKAVYESLATDGKIESAVRSAFDVIGRASAERFEAQTNIPVAVDPYRDPVLRSEAQIFVQENVGLIKSIPSNYFPRLESVLWKGIRNGDSIAAIGSAVSSFTGETQKRAEQIARDQAGRLSGQIDKLRQQQYGIDEYQWIIVGDGRTRPMHKALSGKTFRWDEQPPVTNSSGDRNIPGGDYGCRCWAKPVIR